MIKKKSTLHFIDWRLLLPLERLLKNVGSPRWLLASGLGTLRYIKHPYTHVGIYIQLLLLNSSSHKEKNEVFSTKIHIQILFFWKRLVISPCVLCIITTWIVLVDFNRVSIDNKYMYKDAHNKETHSVITQAPHFVLWVLLAWKITEQNFHYLIE